MSGIKFDQGKPDLSLLPLSATGPIAKAMMVGQEKYGRFNYRQGLAASRLIAACARHLFKWFSGQDTDPETGVSHLGHAGANIIMLLDLEALGQLDDDRDKEKYEHRPE